MRRRVLFALALALLVTGCAKKKHKAAAPPLAPSAAGAAMPRIGDEETGIASWYGHPYHGRRASNGEIYDMEKMTAAHRTLPFGVVVRVENLSNELAADVRITDRGPFVDGRIIDLSRAAAREIKMLGPGTAKVRVRVIGLPAAAPEGYFAVQAGAFKDRDNAERVRKQMADRFGAARLSHREGNPPLWRVLVGHAAAQADAESVAARIKSSGVHAFVVRVDASESNL